LVASSALPALIGERTIALLRAANLVVSRFDA
jgi:hypothetical protein